MWYPVVETLLATSSIHMRFAGGGKRRCKQRLYDNLEANARTSAPTIIR
jgi:hypothetical protein